MNCKLWLCAIQSGSPMEFMLLLLLLCLFAQCCCRCFGIYVRGFAIFNFQQQHFSHIAKNVEHLAECWVLSVAILCDIRIYEQKFTFCCCCNIYQHNAFEIVTLKETHIAMCGGEKHYMYAVQSLHFNCTNRNTGSRTLGVFLAHTKNCMKSKQKHKWMRNIEHVISEILNANSCSYTQKCHCLTVFALVLI